MYGSKDTRICTATTIKPFESTCVDWDDHSKWNEAHSETLVTNDIIEMWNLR